MLLFHAMILTYHIILFVYFTTLLCTITKAFFHSINLSKDKKI
eukprot:UN03814